MESRLEQTERILNIFAHIKWCKENDMPYLSGDAISDLEFLLGEIGRLKPLAVAGETGGLVSHFAAAPSPASEGGG